MICLTAAERSIDAIAQRLQAHDVPLCELRLDALDTIDDTLWPLIERHAQRLLLCLRPQRQGGGYRGSDGERLALLRRGHQLGARWVDLEADLDPVALEGFDTERLVLSWHDFSGVPADLETRLGEMRQRCPAGVVKLAVTVGDAAELGRLLDAGTAAAGSNLLLAMGGAGLLSRSHYRAFGSPWTYVAPSSDCATAAGQLDLEAAAAMRLPDSASWPFLALVGGEQVLASPGPRVYGQLLAKLGIELGYVPVVTRSLTATLPLLERLGVRGLSVTMPLKHEALTLCRADPQTTVLGAANSLLRAPDGWRGTNTDVEGVREPLRRAQASGRALILGAGGAARAAASACAELGLEVVMAARRPERAQRGLAAAGLAHAVEVQPWSQRSAVDASVLINATPLCGDRDPWPDGATLPPLVFDLALGGRSQLLERARAQRREVLEPMAMWVTQGAAQMSWMLDREVSARELEEAL